MSDSSSDKLTRLFELHKAGKISLEEYTLLKKRILEESKPLSEFQQQHDVDEETFDDQKNDESFEAESFEDTYTQHIEKEPDVQKQKPKSTSSKSLKYLFAFIAFIVVTAVGFIIIFYPSSKSITDKVAVSEKISDDDNLTENKFKYAELNLTAVNTAVDNALKEKFRKDYYSIFNKNPHHNSLMKDTVIIKDLNKDNLQDIIVKYFGEDFEVYGNTSQQGWFLLLNNGNSFKYINSNINYKLEFKKFSKDTLFGIVPVYDGAMCCPTSKKEATYLFAGNGFKLVSERTIWEEQKQNEAINTSKMAKTIEKQGKVSSSLQRDPRAKDVANVFWDSEYNLYCKLTDEPIYPNESGKFDIWYASHEEPYPHHKILNKNELSELLFYKFKDYQTCKKWCDAKNNNQ